LVKPSTTPMAKMSGRMVKTAPPEAAMISPSLISQGERSSAPAMELPTPSRMPATGKTETGSISALPIFCRLAKAPSQVAFRFILVSP
jgi:hypothetical protein